MSKKINVTFASGWIRGRMAATDEATGNEEIVAGVDVRIRVDDIRFYHAGPPGVLVLWLCGVPDPLELIGDVPALDKIMGRANLKTVQS